MEIEARHFRLVLTVAELGSLRRAAMAMNLTQPALAMRLRRVESAVGGPLFHRDGDAVRPTEVGRCFLSGARELVDGLETLRRRAADLARPADVTAIRLAATLTVFLEELVDAVRSACPDRRVFTLAAATGSLLGAVAAGAIDFAIAIHYGDGGLLPPAGVSTRPVVEAEPAFVGLSVDHAFAGRAELDLAELADEEWILTAPNDRSGRYDTFRQACEAAGFAPHTGHDVAEWDAMVHLIRSGMGIGLVNPLRQAPEGLVYLPITGNPQHRDLVLCWPTDSESASYAESVWHALVQSYHEDMARVSAYRDWWLRYRGTIEVHGGGVTG